MKKYYKFDLDLIIANIFAIFLLVIGMIFYFMTVKEGIINEKYFGIEILLLLLYFALHELCHGLGYSLFVKNKKNIKYGAALEKSVFYAMCQEEISKKAIIISLLFPLIFLTLITGIIAIIFKIPYLLLLSVINFSGAAGDIIMLFFIPKLPKDIYYIDYDNSIGCTFVSKEDLSNYRGFGIKYVGSGEHKKSLVDKTIPRIQITKPSYIIIIVLIVLALITFII